MASDKSGSGEGWRIDNVQYHLVPRASVFTDTDPDH